jgi:hypothetical protein
MRRTNRILPLPLRERAGVRGKRVEANWPRPPGLQKLNFRNKPGSLHALPLTLTLSRKGRGDQTNARVLPGVTKCYLWLSVLPDVTNCTLPTLSRQTHELRLTHVDAS